MNFTFIKYITFWEKITFRTLTFPCGSIIVFASIVYSWNKIYFYELMWLYCDDRKHLCSDNFQGSPTVVNQMLSPWFATSITSATLFMPKLRVWRCILGVGSFTSLGTDVRQKEPTAHTIVSSQVTLLVSLCARWELVLLIQLFEPSLTLPNLGISGELLY